jgi:ribosome biogenesis GTPase
MKLGWSQPMFAHLSVSEAENPPVARVAFIAHGQCQLLVPEGVIPAILDGSTRREGVAVGDWVVVRRDGDPAVVTRVLPRMTELVRRDPGGGPQVVAANVDVAWIATSADRDWNPRRLERYLALVGERGLDAVVVVTKAELPDADAIVSEVAQIAGQVPVVPVSARADWGRGPLLGYLRPGKTACLLGSSGVGKTTLVNWLIGEDRYDTGGVRADDGRGKHTTTARQLIALPNDAWLIDNPGIRGVGLVDAEDGVAAVFPEIDALAAQCRFRDCGHDGEPGCAVQAGLDDGTVAPERFAAWVKLLRELAFEERKQSPRARREALQQWKRVHKAARQRDKLRR